MVFLCANKNSDKNAMTKDFVFCFTKIPRCGNEDYIQNLRGQG